jgi:hypothetical protein
LRGTSPFSPWELWWRGRRAYTDIKGSKLPFGYYLELDADLLTLRRSDGSFVAAFNVRVDLFDVELMAWEDAD